MCECLPSECRWIKMVPPNYPILAHPRQPGVLRRFETALLYPRFNPRDIISGRLLPSHALPPAKYYWYMFILREWVHQLQRPWAGQHRSRVSWKSIVGTPASVHGSKAVGVACLESMNWVRVTGAGQFYLSHIGGCAPDRVIWLTTLFHSVIWGEIIMNAIGGSNSKVCVRCRISGIRH
jgi:hypothetical protein